MRLQARSWVFIVLVIVLAVLIVPPLYVLVWASFTGGNAVVATGPPTWSWYVEVFTSANSLKLFEGTLEFALPSALLSVLGGLGLAYLTESLRIRALTIAVYAGVFLGFAVPGLVRCIGWIFLLGTAHSLLNRPFGTSVTVESLWGMIFVECLLQIPIAFLLFRGPVRATNMELGDAGRVAGASTRQVTYRILLPLLRPAVLSVGILLLIGAVQSFEVPLFLGVPAGILTISSNIYLGFQGGLLPNYGAACAYGVILLLVLALLLLGYLRATRTASQFQTVGGRGYRRRSEAASGTVKALGLLVALLFVLFEVAPVVFTILSSFTLSGGGTSGWTLTNYHSMFQVPAITSGLRNSIVASLVAATAAALLALGVTWLRIRTQVRGKAGLSLLAGLPLIVPGIIIGLSLRALVIQFKLLSLYQSIWIFVLAYIPLILPYSLRYVEPAMLQISPALEEQARVSGARWTTSSRLILLPLLQVSLISCWVLGFLFSMREFAASSLLSSFGNQVVGPQLFETFESEPSGITSAFAAVVALVGIVVAGAALIVTRRLFRGADDAAGNS